MTFRLETDRLTLSSWDATDGPLLVRLYGDPLASRDFGRTLSETESLASFERYRQAYREDGFTRWKVTDKSGTFLGAVGCIRVKDHQCLGTHVEIGWRLLPEAWSKGYATEGAMAAQYDAQTRCGVSGIITYTAPDNPASQAVMERLDYQRATNRDFTAHYESIGEWHGLVWTVPEYSG